MKNSSDDSAIRVLLVEGNTAEARLLEDLFNQTPGTGRSPCRYEISRAARLSQVSRAMMDAVFDVILLDLELPDSHGLDTITGTLNAAPGIPIVVFSRVDDEGVAVTAVHRGAQDYLVIARTDGYLLNRSIKYAIERRKLQSQLMQAEKLAAMGRLLSGFTHEINNPLTSVIGYADLLLKFCDLQGEIRNHVETIQREGDRARRIIQNLLSFIGSKSSVRTEVDLNEMLERTLELRSYEMQANDIVVRREYGELPSIRADEQRLNQALLSIIINAEQAMSGVARSRILKVKTYLRQTDADEHIVVAIGDTGPGIAASEIDKVFDPFYSSKGLGKAVGLGLSLCHGIIRDHGGAIRLGNAPGGGAAILIELPVTRTAEKLLAATSGSNSVLESEKDLV